MTIQEAARRIVYGTTRRNLEDDNSLLEDLDCAQRRLDQAEAAFIDARANLASALRDAQDAGVVDASGEEIPWSDRP
jgi:hypothetical protein